MVSDLQKLAGGHFRDATTDWVATDGARSPQVAEAWLQFRAARLVWAQLASGQTTKEKVAELAGQGWESQRRKLAGEQPATLADVVTWTLAFGATGSLGVPVDALFPPTYRHMLRGWSGGRGEVPKFGTQIDWRHLAEHLALGLPVTATDILGELLTDQVLLHRVIESLSTLHPWLRDRVRIRTVAELGTHAESSPLAPMVEAGPVGGAVPMAAVTLALPTLVDSAAAEAALWRVRQYLARVAASDDAHGGMVVAAYPSAAESVLADALGAGISIGSTMDPNSVAVADDPVTIGPFEPGARADQESVWWTSHVCELHVVKVATAEAWHVAVLEIGKPRIV